VSGVSADQVAVSEWFGAEATPPEAGTKLGVSRDLRDGGWPLNGLRHPPEAGTNGWYLWVGAEPGSDADYFVPLHVEHLVDWRPEACAFLALPPGWRFLIAPGHEDVWFDAALLRGFEKPV
jgi:hypothetical protein